MQLEALYDNGHVILLQQDKLPAGTMRVTVNFPDDQADEISDAWKAEVDRRLQKIARGEGSFVDGDAFLKERLAAYDA